MLTNCVVSGNADNGVFCWEASPLLTNCTIVGNGRSGVSLVRESCPVLTNCIVWDNGESAIAMNPDLEDQSLPSEAPDASIEYSCIEGIETWPGVGNISQAPRFTRKGVFDFDRFCRGGPDMGAYESGNCPPSLFRRGDSNADGQNNLTDAVPSARVLVRAGFELRPMPVSVNPYHSASAIYGTG